MTSGQVCSMCGAGLEPEARFCKSCASPVEQPSDVAPQDSSPVNEDTPVAIEDSAPPKEETSVVKEYTPHFVKAPSHAADSSHSCSAHVSEGNELVSVNERSDLSIPDKCSVCGHSVSVNHEVYCRECGCRAHMGCWIENDGCGEEYCHCDESALLMASTNLSGLELLSSEIPVLPAILGKGGTDFALHGNGSVELVTHDRTLEKRTLTGMIASGLTAWLFGPFSVWIYLITSLSGVLSLSWFLCAWYKLRRHTLIQAPSNSISSDLRYFGKRITDKDGFRFKEDIVEVHLQYMNMTTESFEGFVRKLSRTPTAKVPSVRFQCSLLTIEDEYIPLFYQTSRFLSDVVNVAEEIAKALDVPIRKMGMGPPLTRQERKRLIGRHVGDGIS